MVTRAVPAPTPAEEILATVARDLRPPLSAISAVVSMMRGVDPDPIIAQQLDIVSAAVDRMTRLADDIVDCAALAAGRFAVACEPIDITALVVDVVAIHREPADAREIALTYELAPGTRVSCDHARIRRVLCDLIRRAVALCRPRDRVHLAVTVDGDRARFVVTDTGVADDELPRMFEPRWTSAQAIRHHVCRGIVEAHGGQIWAERAPDAGTRVTFTLPIVD